MPRFSMDLRVSFTATRLDPAAPDPAVEGWQRDQEIGEGDRRECVFEREVVVEAADSGEAKRIAVAEAGVPVVPGWQVSEFEAWVGRGLTYALEDEPAPAGNEGNAMTKVHEITLAGFDGGTDDTDDLVVWVSGDRAAVEAIVSGTGATLHDEVDSATDEDVDFRLPADAERLSARIAEHDAALAASPGAR